jgi:hypothetical protein
VRGYPQLEHHIVTTCMIQGPDHSDNEGAEINSECICLPNIYPAVQSLANRHSRRCQRQRVAGSKASRSHCDLRQADHW